jgi:hypothetical protein
VDKKVKILIASIMLPVMAVPIAVMVGLHSPEVYCMLGIFIFYLLVVFMLIIFGIFTKPVNRTMGQAGVIPYSDKLISIDDEGITIRIFYFPFCGAKRVNFSDIEIVWASKGGCFRLWGSDDFRTWFGLDSRRMSRSMTFIITQKNKWSRVGFTCEDSESVAKILQLKNLLQVKTGW